MQKQEVVIGVKDASPPFGVYDKAKGTVSGYAYANGVSADGKVVVGFGKKEWGPGGAIGWVWTQKRGRLVPAKAFFAEFGYNDPEFDIGWVMVNRS